MATSPHPPVRLGIAGIGFMGRQHMAFVQRNPKATLVAAADPVADPSSAGIPVHRSIADMIAREHLDGVIIVNPNALHVDSAIECLEAGLAVLLEKPVAESYVESLRLVDAVERFSGRLLVGHHRRHHPAVSRTRAALDAGAIGDLVGVSGMWSARKQDNYFTDMPWHSEPGAGVMLINLVHDLDLLRHLCGDVSEIQAITSNHARGLAVEDSVTVNLRFAGGAIGSFFASDAGVSPWGWDQATEDSAEFPFVPDTMAYQLVGSRGAITVPNLAHYRYDEAVTPDWHSPLSRSYLAAPAVNSYDAQLAHFIDVVRGTADPLVSASDAARTLALIEAATLAATQQQTVHLDDFYAVMSAA